jgi:hypothetical protein
MEAKANNKGGVSVVKLVMILGAEQSRAEPTFLVELKLLVIAFFRKYTASLHFLILVV